MSLPRFLTDYGLGYYRGGFPAFNYANDTAMLAEYPMATSARLEKLGGGNMYDYIPGQWVMDYNAGLPDADLLLPFTAASGAYRVTDSRGKEILCPKPEKVYERLAVSSAQNAIFHPTLTTAASYSGKFFQYNDEDLIWEGMYAGVRAKLYDNWGNSGLPPYTGYTEADRNADHTAWLCAIEGATAVFGYLTTQLVGSRWTIHLMPTRPQNTLSVPAPNGIYLTDLNYGQTGSGARWRGIGATGEQATQAATYADLWVESAKQAYQPIADQLGWICPRVYIDNRMRNWDQEVPGQEPPFGWTVPATADLIRESFYKSFEDQVAVAKHIANGKPLYPAIIPIHSGQSNNVTNETDKQDWYLGLNVDLESHREQMRRILDDVTGISFWSSDDNIAREAFYIGKAPMDIEGNDTPSSTPVSPPPGGDVFATGYTMPNVVKLRVRTQRRFPGVFDHLHPHPTTEAEDAQWRSVENWNLYHQNALKQVESMAVSAVLLGSAKQSTLTSLIGG
jgi:hypothetical protein